MPLPPKENNNRLRMKIRSLLNHRLMEPNKVTYKGLTIYRTFVWNKLKYNYIN